MRQIKACINRSNRKLEPVFGARVQYVGIYYCPECGHRGPPIIFDTEEAYQKFKIVSEEKT